MELNIFNVKKIFLNSVVELICNFQKSNIFCPVGNPIKQILSKKDQIWLNFLDGSLPEFRS